MMSLRLKHRVKVLKKEGDDWVEHGLIYASFESMDAQQLKFLDKNFGHILISNYFVFCMRFTNKIQMDHRLELKGRVFQVKKLINKDECSKILQIIALEISYGS